jgi:hypothetical protein
MHLDKGSCDNYPCDKTSCQRRTMHTALIEHLARDRALELRHNGNLSRWSRRESRRPRVTGALRRGTGWLLIEWGLRLAVPRSATSHPVARAQR